jgi:predicted GNAT family N-acyltransferase
MITNNHLPIFKVIDHGGPEYLEAVRLREDILRKPLGLIFTSEELLNEIDHIHISGFLDGKIISTAVLVPEGSECKLQRVVVKQELQASGIGSKMMAFCEAYAKTQGFNSIYCHARYTAVLFYIENNYMPEGDYFDEDTILHRKMRKAL